MIWRVLHLALRPQPHPRRVLVLLQCLLLLLLLLPLLLLPLLLLPLLLPRPLRLHSRLSFRQVSLTQ
jgi:hypothetical protein